MPKVNNGKEYYIMAEYPRNKLDISEFCKNYPKEVELAFSGIKPLDLKTANHSNAKQTKLCNKLCETLHYSVIMSLGKKLK